MSDTVVGGLGLVGLAVVAVAVMLSWRRRSPTQVITSGSAHGRTGLAIHPWRGHLFTVMVGWLVPVGVIVLGLSYLDTSVFAAVVVGGAGVLLLYLAWAGASGRAGDGTLTMTPIGLHQRWRGSDVLIPWDVVTGLVTSRTELIVETDQPVVPVRHLPGWLGRPRAVATERAIGLPYGMLPPLPYQEMIELYATDPSARDELATSDPAVRAQQFLAGQTSPAGAHHPSTTDQSPAAEIYSRPVRALSAGAGAVQGPSGVSSKPVNAAAPPTPELVSTTTRTRPMAVGPLLEWQVIDDLSRLNSRRRPASGRVLSASSSALHRSVLSK